MTLGLIISVGSILYVKYLKSPIYASLIFSLLGRAVLQIIGLR